MLHYEKAVESKRRRGQRRIEVFSPKLNRRVTLFSWDSHDVWLLLEADPTVQAFCERPAYVDQFWQSVVERMKRYGFYFVDPRLVSIEFRGSSPNRRRRSADN